MPGILDITRKPSARPYWVSARERSGTRAMLLDKAVALIARDGEDALTLGAVADEAGIARATIYGYFSGKRDLFAALNGTDRALQAEPAKAHASEEAHALQPDTASTDQQPEQVVEPAHVIVPEVDKSVESEFQTEFAFSAGSAYAQEDRHLEDNAEAFGAAPHDVEIIEQPANELPEELGSDGEHPVSDAVEAAGHVGDAPVAADIGEAEEFAGTAEPQETSAVASDSDETESLTPHEQERRLQASRLEEIAKRLILPESAFKEGTDALISRLETRLRVLERSISGLETRQNAAPDETEKKFKPVSDLVTQLQMRADAMEDRQRQALAELRLSIHELTARQSVLNTGPTIAPVQSVWPETGSTPVKAEEPSADETSAEKPKECKADDGGQTGYLSTARNLAKEGARQAAERESQIEEDQRRRRQFLTAAGVAGLCLVAVGVLFMLRPGPHGVSVARAKSLSHMTGANNVTPLDRLTALANRGDARAELVVGLKYLKGDGVPASDKGAAQWFERAANSGNPIAENHLGELYQAGRGVPADMNQAIHWYEAAALQGDRHAMNNLAVLYAGGSAGTKNFAEAARWFQRSAELGYLDAQFDLAVLYERGDGVPQSLLDAYKWYSIAAAAGDHVAKTRADAIATQVSSQELQAAQQGAANFRPQPLDRATNEVPTVAEVLASR